MAPRKRKADSAEGRGRGPARKKQSASPRVKIEPDTVHSCSNSIVTCPEHSPLPLPLPLPSNEVSPAGRGSPQSPPELPPLQIFCQDCFSFRKYNAIVPLYQYPCPVFIVPLLIPIITGFPNQYPETVSVPTSGSRSSATTTTETLSNGTTAKTTTVFTNSPSMTYYRFTPTISVALASTITTTVITSIHPLGPPRYARQVKIHSFIHTCRALPTCPAGSPCPWAAHRCTGIAGEDDQSEDEGLGKDEY